MITEATQFSPETAVDRADRRAGRGVRLVHFSVENGIHQRQLECWRASAEAIIMR